MILILVGLAAAVVFLIQLVRRAREYNDPNQQGSEAELRAERDPS